MTKEGIVENEEKIRLDWSPEQVSGWLEDNQGIAISHGRIYQHIWADKRHGGTLYTHLRQSNKKRKKSNMAPRISVDRSEIVSALMNVPPSLQKKPALAIGRLIP